MHSHPEMRDIPQSPPHPPHRRSRKNRIRRCRIRAITAGRGRHREKFVRFEDVPREIEPKIIAEYGRKVEEE